MGMSPRCYPTNTWRKSLDIKKGPNLRWSLIQCSGGDEGDRTPDLLTASQALSQLSYAPVRRSTIRELERRCKDIFGKTFRGGDALRPIGAAACAHGALSGQDNGPRGAPRGPRRCRRPPCGPPATKPAHLLRLAGIPRPWRLRQK